MMVARLMERPALAEWIVDDSYRVVIEEKYVPPVPAKGELRNANFPTEAAPREAWTGTIEGINTGGSTGTFRWRVPGLKFPNGTDTSDSFDLDPGYYSELTVNGTGPMDFMIYFERYA